MRARLAFLSPLSGVGGGGVYIDRTVDKMSFVIQDYQTQYFGRLHRNHDKDATLIENDPLLQDETFACVGTHEQLREGGYF